MSLRPTPLGARVLLIGSLLFVACCATPYGELLFLLLVPLAGLSALALASTRRNLRGVGGRMREAAAAPAGLPCILDVEVKTGGFACDGLEVRVELEGGTRVEASTTSLRGPAVLHLELPPLPRGVYRVKSCQLGSTWPFGVLRAAVSIEHPEELIVHPAPLAAPLAAPLDAGPPEVEGEVVAGSEPVVPIDERSLVS